MTARRDPGEGSVYQEGDHWRAALVIDGKTVRRRAPNEKAAKLKLKELMALRDQRLAVGAGKQTLATWLDHWLNTLLPAKQAKANTLDGYRYACDHYIIPYLGRHQLVKLTAQHVDEWQAQLRAKGLSEGTIANARRRLSAALEMARKRKIVAENVVMLTDAPLSTPTRKLVLDEEQIVTLLSSLREHRLYALFVLASSTGMRKAELFGLRWGAVELDTGALTVREQLHRIRNAEGKTVLHREQSTKSRNERTISLSAELIAVLHAHRQRQRQERLILGDAWKGDDLVFTSEHGTPLDPSTFTQLFKRALRRAGLPDVHFHSLRHSAGSIMLSHGAPLVAVSEVLGHSSVAVTARIYAHSFDKDRRQAVAAATTALLRRA